MNMHKTRTTAATGRSVDPSKTPSEAPADRGEKVRSVMNHSNNITTDIDGTPAQGEAAIACMSDMTFAILLRYALIEMLGWDGVETPRIETREYAGLVLGKPELRLHVGGATFHILVLKTP